MSAALDLLWLPGCAAIVFVGIHTYFGLQVLARGVIFVDLALAQIAALGATVAFMLGHPPQSAAAYAYSLAFTLAGAVLLAATRSWAGRISQEALIGVIYVVGAAIAFLLVERAPAGAEHIKQILTGNILVVGANELLAMTPLYLVIGIGHARLNARLKAAGWPSELVFFVSLGIVVTSSVALAGVLLVFSFLIMPAAIGVLFAERFGRRLAIGWSVGVLASLAGLAMSYAADLPTGATLVCAFGLALSIAGLASKVAAGIDWRGATRVLGGIVASLALIAAGWILVAPRSDQPLLDLAEAALPPLRDAYLSGREREIMADARRDAARFRGEAERLNRIEVESRSAGTVDDEKLRRIASFLKSYHEMHKGEQFVSREVVARARERNRGWIGGVLVLAAVLVASIAARVTRR